MSKPIRAPISLGRIDEAPRPVPVEGLRPPEPTPVAAQQPAAPAAAPPGGASQQWRKASTRIGRRGVAFYLPPDAFRQLSVLSAMEDRTVQDLMVEATNMLFQSRGLARIAKPEE